jgi:hypothetical protein
VTSENIKIPENCNVPTPHFIHSTSFLPLPPHFIRKHQHSAFTNWKSKSNNRMNASELLGYEYIILFLFPFGVEFCLWTNKNWVNIGVIRNVLENKLVRKMTILRKGNNRVLVSPWDGNRSWYSDLLQPGSFGVLTWVEARDFPFSTPVQTGPGAHAASCTINTKALFRG